MPLIDPGLVDPELVEPVDPIDPLLVVVPERREWLRVADEAPPVPVDIDPLLIEPLPIDPPGAVLPEPGDVLVIVPGVAPVPAEPPGLLPAICAPAAVAISAAVITINAFMATLLDWVLLRYWGVDDGGVAVLGASVPTRPSPVVPADVVPIGGVTPVAGCGRAGVTGEPGDIAELRPDGVVPGAGIAPAGE